MHNKQHLGGSYYESRVPTYWRNTPFFLRSRFRPLSFSISCLTRLPKLLNKANSVGTNGNYQGTCPRVSKY